MSGRELPQGLQRLLFKVVQRRQLNTLTSNELNLIHVILTRLYSFILNAYLLRQAMGNIGTYDNGVLGRKVPLEYWRLVYDVCLEVGMNPKDLAHETIAGDIWKRLNSDEKALSCFTQRIFQKIGLQNVYIDPLNLRDGNFLFNLGSVLPSRSLMVLLFCLKHWGQQPCEPWVRFFAGKMYVLYLIIAGYIIPRRAAVESAIAQSYSGLLETVMVDILNFNGIQVLTNDQTEYLQELDIIYAFDNNVLPSHTTATVTGSAPRTKK